MEPIQLDRRRSGTLRSLLLVLAVSATAVSVTLEPVISSYPLVAGLEALVIISFAAAGQLLARDPAQQKNGALLTATALLQFATHLHLVDNTPLPLVAWICGPLSAIPIAIVLLRFPSEKLDPVSRWWVIFQTTWLIVSRLVFVIPAPERRLGWWPALPMSAELAVAASAIGNVVLAASVFFFIALLVRKISRSRALARHELMPIVVSASVASVTIVLHLVSVADSRSGVPPWILALEQLGLIAVPLSFAASAVSMRLARASVADLLLRAGASINPTRYESELATTLSDPGLTLHLYRPLERQWINTKGEPSSAPDNIPGCVTIPISTPEGQPLAVIKADAGVARNKPLLDATLAAATLTLHNAAVLTEIRESRARMAEAALSERRRLARDLHDGAQQSLLALGISLDQLRHYAVDDATLRLAQLALDHNKRAIRELRDLARGVHPEILTQSGLAAAIECLVEQLPFDIRVTIPQTRWASDVEATLYFCISEVLNNALKHSSCVSASVHVTDRLNAVEAVVTDDGIGGARPMPGSGLLGLQDRVLALGGEFQISSPAGGGTCITIRVPSVSQ